MDVFEKIKEFKIIPVATVNNLNDAIPLGKALIEAGLPVLEITFRTEVAAESIKKLMKDLPNLFIGAGTVLQVDQVKKAVNAGALFIVTPGFNPSVVDYCVNNDIIIVPGLNSASFIEWGLERGLNHFKFFPANLSGGPKMLQAFSGPYPTVQFMPTGGINNITLIEYLRLTNVFACGGSWIVKKDLIDTKQFKEIELKTKEAVSLIRSLKKS